MSDGGSLVPLTDEQSKLLREIVGAIRGGGAYLDDMMEDLPKDLIGRLFGDKLKVSRAVRQQELVAAAIKKLADQGIKPEAASFKIALPILEAAADEKDDDVQDLWARLLAAEMHPGLVVRQKFITALKALDPADAKLFEYVCQLEAFTLERAAPALTTVKETLRITNDEFQVSMDNLFENGFIDKSGMKFYATSFGKLFWRAVSLKS